MKYIITGGTGFIGKNIIERIKLFDNDADVINIGRDCRINLIDLFEYFNPDYIIHCAAEIYNEDVMIDSNINLTYKLLNASKNVNYKMFVNIGSSSEYGYKISPMKESDICVPRTIYEATKYSSTILCQGFANRYNKNIITIRPFSVYGNHEPSHRFIPTLNNCFKNNIIPNISQGVHDFIYIDDFIDNLFNIMYNYSNVAGDIVNFGTGIQTSNFELFDIFKHIYDINLSYNKVSNLRVFDSLHWVADMSYAISKYNFKINTTLENGIRKYIKLQK